MRAASGASGATGGAPRSGSGVLKSWSDTLSSVTPVEDLQQETADVLGRLIQFNTVNPPGNERAAAEWLGDYLSDAGLEIELDGAEPDRPNLVATLGDPDSGPVLGYLGHTDTVLADPDAWSRDPWSGEQHDGFVWGRGAIDMKSQVAAEAVAAAHLARSGWRPERGALKLFAVADEETGGSLGAQWLTENRPDLARCDYLLNEGAGTVMPYGERRLYGVCCAEKGTFRFGLTASGRAGHASVPALADNALLKLLPALERLAGADLPFDLTEQTRGLLSGLGEDPDDPAGAIERIERTEPRIAAIVRASLGLTVAPTMISASQKINVIPNAAELRVDCRAPAGMEGDTVAERLAPVLGEDGLELTWFEQTVGNHSPVDSPLMDAIRAWVGETDAGAEAIPTVLPAFTDSRWWRHAFPDCVAYGFFPQRHQNLYETWPLIHGADERIDVRDLGVAVDFYAQLPKRMLA
jgi:acetylornithine deacetylase/succinyl-diaminopimelate desuccinylase-like protein